MPWGSAGDSAAGYNPEFLAAVEHNLVAWIAAQPASFRAVEECREGFERGLFFDNFQTRALSGLTAAAPRPYEGPGRECSMAVPGPRRWSFSDRRPCKDGPCAYGGMFNEGTCSRHVVDGAAAAAALRNLKRFDVVLVVERFDEPGVARMLSRLLEVPLEQIGIGTHENGTPRWARRSQSRPAGDRYTRLARALRPEIRLLLEERNAWDLQLYAQARRLLDAQLERWQVGGGEG